MSTEVAGLPAIESDAVTLSCITPTKIGEVETESNIEADSCTKLPTL